MLDLHDVSQSIDATDLRILHALAQSGSLTGVSEALHISQPAITQRIKRLETKLGVPLTERFGRKIRLAPAGQILASHGAKIVAELEVALDKISALCDTRGGEFRLVGFPSASATIVPEMMRAMREIAPVVTFKYREAEPPEALELLSQGEVDCAIIFDYQSTTKLPSNVIYEQLWYEELNMVAASSDPRIKPGRRIRISDFQQDHWIAGCPKCRGHLLTAAAEQGFAPDIVQETDNIPAMIAMVAAGGAVAMVPELALSGMRMLPEGVHTARMIPARQRSVGIAFLGTTQPSPAVKLAYALSSRVDYRRWNLQLLND
ncbi:LysR family transcriptional regulator [Canibacter sp. lx-72]|uniref:LysR family transcriptional regulator n=1 Tax=Canibacter zhuwentaonis TaxID=2837491 RepID=UPI001BDD7440|nr:LysR family transcriptional regulator [Canibacter zhuwentaonis]